MVKSGYDTSIVHTDMLESSKISNKNVEEIRSISSNMTQHVLHACGKQNLTVCFQGDNQQENLKVSRKHLHVKCYL